MDGLQTLSDSEDEQNSNVDEDEVCIWYSCKVWINEANNINMEIALIFHAWVYIPPYHFGLWVHVHHRFVLWHLLKEALFALQLVDIPPKEWLRDLWTNTWLSLPLSIDTVLII